MLNRIVLAASFLVGIGLCWFGVSDFGGGHVSLLQGIFDSLVGGFGLLAVVLSAGFLAVIETLTGIRANVRRMTTKFHADDVPENWWDRMFRARPMQPRAEPETHHADAPLVNPNWKAPRRQ